METLFVCYLFVAFTTSIILVIVAPSLVTIGDIVIASLIWPYTGYLFIKEKIKS